jgi:capsid protein
MPSINPTDDRKAAAMDQANGWDSRAAIIRRFGRDPTQVDGERAQDTAIPNASNSTPPSEPQDTDPDNAGL